MRRSSRAWTRMETVGGRNFSTVSSFKPTTGILGFVTKQEFHDVCKNLTEDQVEQLLTFLGTFLWKFLQVALAFSQFDTSGDDKLNYREFCLMIVKREEER